MVVENNTPDQPRVEVPLSATGGGQPTCTLTILLRRMDFGLVARGSNTTREFNILNRGTGHCDITNQEVVPLIDIQFRFQYGPLRYHPAGTSRAYWASATLPMKYPSAANLRRGFGKLQLTYNDPFENEQRVAEADLWYWR